MHHPKEVEVDGVKFVLIPEELVDRVISALEGDPNFKVRGDLAKELRAA